MVRIQDFEDPDEMNHEGHKHMKSEEEAYNKKLEIVGDLDNRENGDIAVQKQLILPKNEHLQPNRNDSGWFEQPPF